MPNARNTNSMAPAVGEASTLVSKIEVREGTIAAAAAATVVEAGITVLV
jgi:hypothetical protein